MRLSINASFKGGNIRKAQQESFLQRVEKYFKSLLRGKACDCWGAIVKKRFALVNSWARKSGFRLTTLQVIPAA